MRGLRRCDQSCVGTDQRLLRTGNYVQGLSGRNLRSKKGQSDDPWSCERRIYIGSDVPAILKYTRDVYYIGNQEMARVRKGEITFYNLDGEEIEKELKTVEWDAEAAEKSGYEHFMIKEIHEQPKAVSDTLNSVIKDGMIDLSEVGLSEEEIKEISQIYIVACGSAYHVGVAAQYVMEDLARIPVRVELASEFRYRNPILDP